MNDIMRALIQQNRDRDPDVPSQREWGKSAITCVRSSAVLEICHAMLSSLHWRSVDQTTKRDGSDLPSLPGKLATEAPAFLDVVGYMFTESRTIAR